MVKKSQKKCTNHPFKQAYELKLLCFLLSPDIEINNIRNLGFQAAKIGLFQAKVWESMPE